MPAESQKTEGDGGGKKKGEKHYLPDRNTVRCVEEEEEMLQWQSGGVLKKEIEREP